jgi:hypothetical protein
MIHHAVPAGEQAMSMGGLRNTFSRVWALWQEIAFDDRNMVKMLAECASCEQPAYAGSKHDR